MKVPITQSREWQRLQDDLGAQSFFVQSESASPDPADTHQIDPADAHQADTTSRPLRPASAFQYLAIKKHTPVGNYLYLPYGPVATTEAGFKQALVSLDHLAREQRAIFTRIEPQLLHATDYLPASAKKTRDLSPKETWLLDLTGPEADLKKRLPARLLRYHKHYQEKGITIETSHDPADIHYLLDLQRALARTKHIHTHSEHYLQTELAQPFATLYLVKHQAQVIAAGLVFDDATTRYNLQGAQSDLGRRLHATGILTIQLILDAAEQGKTTFDFWGIAPTTPVTPTTPDGFDPTHPWAGFTAFKKTFAGHEAIYAGTYDLVHQPARYKLYQFLRRHV